MLLFLLLLDWWNSSIAAGGAIMTAHELKTLFNDLLVSLQRDHSRITTEVGVLAENERRTRDEIRQELAGIRKEVIAVLLSRGGGRGEGWSGEGLAEEAGRLLTGGRKGMQVLQDRGERGDRDRDSWLSSLVEKTVQKAGLARDKEGDDRERQGVWDHGYMSGWNAQQSYSQGGGGAAEPGNSGRALNERYQQDSETAANDNAKQR